MRILLFIALLFMGQLHIFAQSVSNDNEDQVNKIDTRFSHNDYVEGQVLLKFKDSRQVKVHKAPGRIATTDVNSVSEVLKRYGVEDMEKILPYEQPNRALRKARAYNGQTVSEKKLSQLYQVRLGDNHRKEVEQMVAELNKLDEVEFAEPNYKVYIFDDVTLNGSFFGNPYVNSQWYLNSYGVKTLWSKQVVNPARPVIAILDTGVDITHPDLVDNLWTNAAEADGEEGFDNDNNGFMNDVHGWDFVNNTGNLRDNNMHGTHVAGIAAASNNQIGIVGANPQAYIMPVTVMQSDGTGDVATIVRGIDYAVANGATVLNMSIGTYANSSAMRQALERAYQSCVIVAAAGNDGLCLYASHSHPLRPKPCFPAAYSFVLGVQATTDTGTLAGFSNYDDDGATYSCESTFADPDGFNYELKAPGTDILSTIPGGRYKTMNGTSMAAPLVAGSVSALMMVKDYKNQEILWGDLLHSQNIAGAYAISSRPAELDLMRIMYRERKELTDASEEDYSGDGNIDAGETVSLYPVIRTTFGEAKNIRMHLELGENEDSSVVEILNGPNNKVDFGMNLSAYGKGVSMNPLRLRVADDVADGRHVKMKMVATCDSSNVTYIGLFTFTVDNITKISGLIDEDLTLTADKTWLVENNVAIPEGVTLSIEPGTRVEFNAGVSITCEGDLDIHGEPGNMVVFANRAGQGTWSGIKVKPRVLNYVYTNTEQTKVKLFYSEETPIQQTVRDILYMYYKQPYVYWINGKYLDFEHSEVSLVQQDGYDWFGNAPAAFVAGYTIAYIPTLSYCMFEGVNINNPNSGNFFPSLDNCIIKNSEITSESWSLPNVCTSSLYNNTIRSLQCSHSKHPKFIKNNNIVTNILPPTSAFITNAIEMEWDIYQPNNIFNITGTEQYISSSDYTAIKSIKSETPSYLGTGKEEIARLHCFEIGRNSGNKESNNKIDLSNMLTQPLAEAHGIVWKVVVDDYDAQDQYDELPPLGVGQHKFEVYFNRPMNKEVTPNISFGLRAPYTQNAVNENGSWNEAGTVYTAYKTITAKTKSDGVNRIYVYGAEDDEFFETPEEKMRFNINIQSAGSMATGFAAEAGLGRVNLTWDNENNNFDDAMGFNVYRYSENEAGTVDTLRINNEIIDVTETEFTDYDVVPGKTYCYYYKVLSTDLQEYDISNVVAVTMPNDYTLGDANGSGEVDVADVITTVNYVAGMEPKPFIFNAADMNTDQSIDILDVVGIIQVILNPDTEAKLRTEAVATYTVEDGIVYVETPVALGGVQLQLNIPAQSNPRVLETLKGFENASAWITDEDYIFLAYNMNGKSIPAGRHPLLDIGGAQLRNIRMSDCYGANVKAEPGNSTAIEMRTVSVANTSKGIYNLNGQKVAGSADELQRLPRGIYIVNGTKIAK